MGGEIAKCVYHGMGGHDPSSVPIGWLFEAQVKPFGHDSFLYCYDKRSQAPQDRQPKADFCAQWKFRKRIHAQREHDANYFYFSAFCQRSTKVVFSRSCGIGVEFEIGMTCSYRNAVGSNAHRPVDIFSALRWHLCGWQYSLAGSEVQAGLRLALLWLSGLLLFKPHGLLLAPPTAAVASAIAAVCDFSVLSNPN